MVQSIKNIYFNLNNVKGYDMLKKYVASFSLAFFLVIGIASAQSIKTDKMDWWKDGKFGLFLHWGLYSIGHWHDAPQKGNEHFMYVEQIPIKEYAKIAETFYPKQFNADLWVLRAKKAGMKYIVITAKHHDGFAMYNSPSNNFNIVNLSPWHKDPMVDLATACKKYGLKLCFYYSLGRDWESPNTVWDKVGAKSGNTWDYPNESKKDYQKYINEKVKPQLKELLSQYGPIGMIWFDTPEGTTPSQSEDLRNFILQIQPNCIINNRIGNGFGDYIVSEQKISAGKEVQAWEACITMSRKWGYSKFDNEWKSPELLVRQLVEVVCKGGNLLLNIGPTDLGEFPPTSISNLKVVEQWMKVNAEAIYGTKPWSVLNEKSISFNGSQEDVMGKSDADLTSKDIFPDYYYNQKGENVIYLFARSVQEKKLQVESLVQKGIKIKAIKLLGNAGKISWENKKDKTTIEIPEDFKAVLPVYVFKIEFS